MRIQIQKIRAITFLVSLLLFNTEIGLGQYINKVTYGCLMPTQSSAEVKSEEVLLKTSDAALNASLQQDIDELSKWFLIKPSVYFLNDKLESSYFQTDTYADLIKRDGADPNKTKPDGSIFISDGFIKKEFKDNNGHLWSLPAVLAHEFAHAMQAKNSCPFPSGIKRELHADFLAGWYIAHRYRYGFDPVAGFNTIFRKGTDKLGYFDENNHGTTANRIFYTQAGFNFNLRINQNAVQAYQEGIHLLNQNLP
jgi:hypothetical protein